MKSLTIVCIYNKRDVLEKNLLKSLKNQTFKDYRLILIDSVKHNFNSAASALNYALKKVKTNYVIFSHQDIILTDVNALTKILNYCEYTDFSIAGVAGFCLGNRNRLKTYSNIVHGYNRETVATKKNVKYVKSVYSIDECFFIINLKGHFMFRNIGQTWHLYATDYALQSHERKRRVVVFPIELWHCSDAKSFSIDYFDAIYSLCKLSKSREKDIYTFWGKWPTNLFLLNVKLLYRKIRYLLKGR